MAWVDDRIWCHGKFADISDHAFATYVKGLAYSSGLNCRGHLTQGQQRLISSTAKARRELVAAGLWDENGDGTDVYIHDWDEHNSKRDDRRERDRERKRKARLSAGQSADIPQDAPQDSPADSPADRARTNAKTSATTARVEGSDGSEGSDLRTKPSFLPSVLQDAEEGRITDQELVEHLVPAAADEDIPF